MRKVSKYLSLNVKDHMSFEEAFRRLDPFNRIVEFGGRVYDFGFYTPMFMDVMETRRLTSYLQPGNKTLRNMKVSVTKRGSRFLSGGLCSGR